MKNVLLLIFAALLITSCENESLVKSTKPNDFSDEEIKLLHSIGIDASRAVEIDGYIVSDVDYVISKEEVNNALLRLNSRHSTLEPWFIPPIADADNISILVDPSFSSLPEWDAALDGAINCINELEHTRVHVDRNGTVGEYDIFLFQADATNTVVPAHSSLIAACNRSSTVAAAMFPQNENVGDQIILCSDHLTIEPKEKVMIHEIFHTLGIHHACGYNANNYPGFIHTTFEAPIGTDECDSTSVVHPFINTIRGGDIPDTYCSHANNPGGPINPNTNGTRIDDYFPPKNSSPKGSSPTDTSPDGSCPWMNPDDVFTLRAMYPYTYRPLSFDIQSCDYTFSDTKDDPSATVLFEVCLNYIENDFVPYEMLWSLSIRNIPIGKTTTYRCWPDCIIFEVDRRTYDSYDFTEECLEVNLHIQNHKIDYSNSAKSGNCCFSTYSEN